jgi:hypothetical protein
MVVVSADIDSDLEIADDEGNVLARFENGNIKTKNFDSSQALKKDNIVQSVGTSTTTMMSQQAVTEELAGKSYTDGIDSQMVVVSADIDSDLEIADDEGNVLARFENGNIKTKNFDSSNVPSFRNRIRILCYGNSWSNDAFNYLPALIENIVENVDVQFGIMYIGGCKLEGHYECFIDQSKKYYTFHLWKTETGKWLSYSSKAFNFALENYEWDIVLFQQQSSAARDYSTYQPYLNDLIDGIFGIAKYPIKIGWHMTPPYPAGHSPIGDDTSESMYEKIVSSVQKVIDETAIQFVIPDGTAIINAMSTTLDSLGDFGHLFQEGAHLQEGIPCILETYVAAMKIFEIYGINQNSIFCSSIRPTEDWIDSINGLQRNGESVGVTEGNILLAQKVAMISIKKPFERTDCGALFE